MADGQTFFASDLGFPAIPVVEPKPTPTPVALKELTGPEPHRRYVHLSLPLQTQVLVRRKGFGRELPHDSFWFTQTPVDAQVLDENEARSAGVTQTPPGYVPVRLFTAETLYADGEHLVITPSEIVFIRQEVVGSRTEKPDDVNLFQLFDTDREVTFWYNVTIDKGDKYLAPIRSLFKFKVRRVGEINNGHAMFELLEPCVGIRFNYEKSLSLNFKTQLRPLLKSLRDDIARGQTNDAGLVRLREESERCSTTNPMMFEVHSYPIGTRFSLPIKRELVIESKKTNP